MKNLNITYDDEDFELIEAFKNKTKLSWEEFILASIRYTDKQKIREYVFDKQNKKEVLKK
jgi:hypothetical protein